MVWLTHTLGILYKPAVEWNRRDYFPDPCRVLTLCKSIFSLLSIIFHSPEWITLSPPFFNSKLNFTSLYIPLHGPSFRHYFIIEWSLLAMFFQIKAVLLCKGRHTFFSTAGCGVCEIHQAQTIFHLCSTAAVDTCKTVLLQPICSFNST